MRDQSSPSSSAPGVDGAEGVRTEGERCGRRAAEAADGAGLDLGVPLARLTMGEPGIEGSDDAAPVEPCREGVARALITGDRASDVVPRASGVGSDGTR